MLLLWWCPFKIQKEKRAGLQFTSTDFEYEYLHEFKTEFENILRCESEAHIESIHEKKTEIDNLVLLYLSSEDMIFIA